MKVWHLALTLLALTLSACKHTPNTKDKDIQIDDSVSRYILYSDYVDTTLPVCHIGPEVSDTLFWVHFAPVPDSEEISEERAIANDDLMWYGYTASEYLEEQGKDFSAIPYGSIIEVDGERYAMTEADEGNYILFLRHNDGSFYLGTVDGIDFNNNVFYENGRWIDERLNVVYETSKLNRID